MTVEIKGLDEIVGRFEKMADTSQIEAAMGKCCALVERSAKQKAPKDEGTLRNSIQSEVKSGESNVVGVVFTPLEYAPYVEFGTGLFAENGNGRKTGWAYEDEETGETIWTRGQRPQPYLRPALNENRSKIIEILEGSIKND